MPFRSVGSSRRGTWRKIWTYLDRNPLTPYFEDLVNGGPGGSHLLRYLLQGQLPGLPEADPFRRLARCLRQRPGSTAAAWQQLARYHGTLVSSLGLLTFCPRDHRSDTASLGTGASCRSRNSSHVMSPHTEAGATWAPSRKARAALPGSGSSTTPFLLPFAKRYACVRFARVLTSGPPISGTRPAGNPSASSTRRPATSPASMGCKSHPLGIRVTKGTRSRASTIGRTNLWNWVDLRMVHGTGEPSTSLSASSLLRK